MKYLVVLFALAASASSQTLHYVINWQSGLSLGEATLTSIRSTTASGASEAAPWSFDLSIDAGVPGFSIRDHYTSTASKELCSAQLDRSIHHGNRAGEETATFDQENHSVTRETRVTGGGKSDIPAPACAHDALAYLQFVRQELAEGKLAPQQPVILGAAYDVRLEFAGTETVKKLGKPAEADKIHATIKGPASDLSVDIFFAKDQARTPLLARIPLALGVFSVELAP